MVCYMVPQTVPKTVHLLSTLPPLSCNEAKMRWSDGEEMVCYEVPQTVSPPSLLSGLPCQTEVVDVRISRMSTSTKMMMVVR